VAGEPKAQGRRLKLLGLLGAAALSFIIGLLCGDHVMGLPRTGDILGLSAQEPNGGSGRSGSARGVSHALRPAALVFPGNGGPGPGPGAASAAGGKAIADPARLLPPPGEFQNQAALILGCNEMVRYYPNVFGEIASALHRNIALICLVSNKAELDLARGILAKHGVPASGVRFLVAPINTLWVRDYVPMFAQRTDGSVLLADFLYEPPKEMERRPLDEAFGKVLGDVLSLPVQPVPLTVEGGNLLTNGEGLVVTTHSIIPRNASRGYDASRVENILGNAFGYNRWTRVPGLIGEATQHADMFMTFLASDVLVVGRMGPAVDPRNAALLDDVAKAMASINGPRVPMKVYRIPMPVPAKAGKGWRTYTNIILANGVLLMPTFSGVDQAAQSEALALYGRLMPGWKVVGINCDALATHMGLLHCVCRQVPAFVSVPAFLRPGQAEPISATAAAAATSEPTVVPAWAPSPIPPSNYPRELSLD
jgi:agmatine/peptidylarginine deiminase